MLYATHAVIDLAAIRYNLAGIRQRVGDRLVLVAVKANAYGHGAVQVSRTIQASGAADWLGVATVPEGQQLRAAGITMPILKLSHVFDDEVDAALAARLTLTVVDEHTIAVVGAAASRLGVVAQVHLAIDTGMRRVGSEPGRAVPLSRLVASHPALELQGVFTHLPISDVPEGFDFTRAELALFLETVAAIQDDREVAGLPPVPMVHGGASAAVLAHDLTGLTMVRPGIMVYGLYPDPRTPRTVELRPAMTLKSRVSFVKRISRGETVGYGRSWQAPEDTWIATVPVGYADGLSRATSNQGRMLIRGRSYPIAGRVCMDQTMLDLGPGIPEGGEPVTEVQVGDEVTWLGRDGAEEITADEIAALTGTINYEVTTQIMPRVTRTFVG